MKRYLRVPAVLNELGAGILISPFALGGVHWFGGGAFFSVPHDAVGGIPIGSQLFFVAQIGAIVLLFEAGMETNRAQFVRYVRPATVVAIGGVVLPFCSVLERHYCLASRQPRGSRHCCRRSSSVR